MHAVRDHVLLSHISDPKYEGVCPKQAPPVYSFLEVYTLLGQPCGSLCLRCKIGRNHPVFGYTVTWHTGTPVTPHSLTVKPTLLPAQQDAYPCKLRQSLVPCPWLMPEPWWKGPGTAAAAAVAVAAADTACCLSRCFMLLGSWPHSLSPLLNELPDLLR